VMMVRAYEKLEMKQLADDARRVLQKNFPENATANAAPGNKAWWKLW
jgi:outer membrane protein assembly factor BamD